MKPSEIDKSLLDPKLDQQTQEIAKHQAIEDSAGKVAALNPLPGPTRKAFSLEPEIKIGPYSVRPACDFDLNLLAQLNNKFHSLFMAGGGDDLPSGPSAWELCWIMTRPARDVSEYVKKNGKGLNGLKESAAEEFQFLQLRDITQLVTACIRQIVSSCETATVHGAPKQGDETEAANATENPR